MDERTTQGFYTQLYLWRSYNVLVLLGKWIGLLRWSNAFVTGIKALQRAPQKSAVQEQCLAAG